MVGLTTFEPDPELPTPVLAVADVGRDPLRAALGGDRAGARATGPRVELKPLPVAVASEHAHHLRPHRSSARVARAGLEPGRQVRRITTDCAVLLQAEPSPHTAPQAGHQQHRGPHAAPVTGCRLGYPEARDAPPRRVGAGRGPPLPKSERHRSWHRLPADLPERLSVVAAVDAA